MLVERDRELGRESNMNPYESPRTQELSVRTVQRLDPGVALIAFLLICGCLASAIGVVYPTVNNYLMPRFGWVGLLLGMNPLIFLASTIKNPTRSSLLGAGFMTMAIGLINACVLLMTGTVDVVNNVFTDRLHSAWLWSVMSFGFAGGYILLAAMRCKK